MAYNPQSYFPAGYQPMMYPQTQQMQMPQQPIPQPKLVEIIPVDSIKEAEDCPMAAGSSAFFFAKDDSFNAVKSVGLNGQVTFAIYDRRPPEPPAPAFNPGDYVRRDEVEKLVSSLVAEQMKREADE